MFYIVGSAGHDINTLGKRTHPFSDGSFMKEFEHNRAVFDELMRLLKLDERFSVLDTAPGDQYVSLRRRTSIANQYQRENHIPRDKMLYVSVHANADNSKTWSEAKGCEVLYYPGSSEGERFARAIAKEISTALNVPNRGIKPRKDLAITRLTTMPAVITEAAFMTNFDEAKKLMDEDLRIKEAFAIYSGICKGFNIQPLIKHDDKLTIITRLNPNQEADIIISTKKPMSVNQIIDVLKNEPLTVSEVQTLLNKVGYFCGEVDGSKGPMTQGAIKAFQRLNGLEETGSLDHDSVTLARSLEGSGDSYRNLWFKDSEVHVFTGHLDDYQVGVGLGTYGKLETLSEMASEYTCAINGQFFNQYREGLGTLITKGLYYFKPNKSYANWIQYKTKNSKIRDVLESELYELQMNTEFVIGTSWPLIVSERISKMTKGLFGDKFIKKPRTIMADTKKGQFSFITVDGERSTSKGMTAKESQELLMYIEKVLDIKFNNAANLSGGSYSEMLLNGKMINKPSEGKEKNIGTFVYMNRKER